MKGQKLNRRGAEAQRGEGRAGCGSAGRSELNAVAAVSGRRHLLSTKACDPASAGPLQAGAATPPVPLSASPRLCGKIQPPAFASLLPPPGEPRRTTLSVAEVARLLRVTPRHVLQLIEQYRDTGGACGLAAIDIGLRALNAAENTPPTRAMRRQWRVPVSAYEQFVFSRANHHTAPASSIASSTPTAIPSPPQPGSRAP